MNKIGDWWLNEQKDTYVKGVGKGSEVISRHMYKMGARIKEQISPQGFSRKRKEKVKSNTYPKILKRMAQSKKQQREWQGFDLALKEENHAGGEEQG